MELRIRRGERKTSKPFREPNAPLAWVKAIFDADTLGESKKHLNTKSQVAESKFRKASPNLRRHAFRVGCQKLSNKKLYEHANGMKTYSVCSNGLVSVPIRPIQIDVDCHKFGSQTDAIDFASFVGDQFFPGAYIEPSDNRGAHAWLLYRHWKESPYDFRWNCENVLEPALKELLARNRHRFNVQGVEIRGLPPLLDYERNRDNELIRVSVRKMGTLARLPRGILDRFDEIKGTFRGDRRAFFGPKVQKLADAFQERRRQEKKSRIWSMPTESARQRRTSSDVCNPPSAFAESGSTSRLPFSTNEATEVFEKSSGVVDQIVHGSELIGKRINKSLLLKEDFASALTVLFLLTKALNGDGTMPHSRVETVWKGLASAGLLSRGFCPNRFNEIKKHLISIGWIEMVDCRYVIPTFNERGEKRKGVAQKWNLSEAAMATIGEAKTFEEAVRNWEESYFDGRKCVIARGEQGEENILFRASDSIPSIAIGWADYFTCREPPDILDFTNAWLLAA